MSPGRNTSCPCGSGKRYKHCCGHTGAATAAPSADTRELARLVGLINQGQPQVAEQRVQALLAVQPAEGMLWKILSVAQRRQGKEALPALARAAQLLPRDPETHANLGAALHERGEWQAALTSLRASLALNWKNPDALIEAADAQRALGNAQEAVTLYQEALRLDPTRRIAHNNLGNAFFALQQAAEAVRCYRRALELQDDDAQVLCNLGNALRVTAEVAEALVCTRRAIALSPGLAMAHNNLGLLLVAGGQRAEAIASFRQALRLDPHYLEALNNLAAALREQGERREPLALYERALQLEPKRADTHSNLGHALLDLRRPADALACFHGALALQPAHAAAHLGLASAQRLLGRAAEAQASCQAALAAEPHNVRALCLLGELRADHGQFAAARELFERALQADPYCTPAYAGIAVHRRMQKDDGAWLSAAQGLLTRALSLDDSIQLRYALGKFYDDVGEYEEAFTHYRSANELTKRYGARYDRARLNALVERLQGLCTPEFLQAARADASQSEQPLFIIGMLRSGTALAEQILASHPAVFGAGEVRFFDRAFSRLQKGELRGGGAAAALAATGREYLRRIGSVGGDAARIADKMPANFLYAGLIHAIFPRARIVHMQRHPLDTCLSVYFQNFFSVSAYANDLDDLAHYYRAYLQIMAHWRAVLPSTALLEVAYEDLVSDPEFSTRRMLQFAGLPWDERCLRFHETDRTVITAGKWQVRQRISAGSVGRWRHYERHLDPLWQLLSSPAVAAAAG